MLKCKFYSYCEGFRVFWIFTLYSKSGRKSANLANKYGYYNDFIEYRCKFCTVQVTKYDLNNKKVSPINKKKGKRNILFPLLSTFLSTFLN